MSLSVTLMKSASPVEKIGKTLTEVNTYDCVLKQDTSILKPVIRIQTDDDILTCNYMYIPGLSRYYFIDDIVSENNNIWNISGHVDVLETYKTNILANSAVIKRQQNKYNLYLNDPDFMTYNNDTIQTKQFSAGEFSKTLTYVLVVNGS